MDIGKKLKGYIKISKGNRDSFSRKNTCVCYVCLCACVCIYISNFFQIFLK